MKTGNVLVLIPIYKDKLDDIERYSVEYSLSALANREIRFIGPQSLDIAYYASHYKNIPFESFPAPCFESIEEYNRLLLSKYFYDRYDDYEFILILQTDAIVLRDELDFWCTQPFDYVGAPWPFGYELFVNLGLFEGSFGRHVRVTVGNGGLSLRRVDKCKNILSEFATAIDVFCKTGSSEDLFFSVMGSLSHDFVVPNEITASRFAMELRPSYYYHVNGGHVPMGGHAWYKTDPEFWKPLLSTSFGEEK
ncbi:MAG: hypothetical protein IPH35_14930 [Rhodoferax sp.]|nr:hypothetical protein [Rhodoferax sp.]